MLIVGAWEGMTVAPSSTAPPESTIDRVGHRQLAQPKLNPNRSELGATHKRARLSGGVCLPATACDVGPCCLPNATSQTLSAFFPTRPLSPSRSPPPASHSHHLFLSRHEYSPLAEQPGCRCCCRPIRGGPSSSPALALAWLGSSAHENRSG